MNFVRVLLPNAKVESSYKLNLICNIAILLGGGLFGPDSGYSCSPVHSKLDPHSLITSLEHCKHTSLITIATGVAKVIRMMPSAHGNKKSPLSGYRYIAKTLCSSKL
mmetsp:Transcript_14916/g.33127  ORF Transcript_14916/g.33127 Transcript_14916/m.33127 type:complete len:107 (-) Transcript_14916:1325-1645(-)